MRTKDYFRRYMKMAPDDGGGASPPASSSGGDSGSSVSTPSPDGGGSSTPPPSPDPTPSPSPASTTPSTPSANPWDNLGSSDDLDTLVVDPVVPPTPTPTPVVPPAPPAATPQAAPQVPPTPTPQPQTTPQPGASAPPVELSPSDPAAIADAIQANRADVIAHLANTRFALSPEEVTELETDAAQAVPKLMAKAYLEAQMSMQRFLAQAVPGMIQKFTSTDKENSKVENQFFEAHKNLGLDMNNASHRQTAIRVAGMYRQMNPQMPLPQLIADVGPMVALALKLAPPTGGTQPQTAPSAPRGGTPFRPAVGGGGGASPAPAAVSEWAGLGATYDD